jgi:tetratricopeptide (TPR) repeat protein
VAAVATDLEPLALAEEAFDRVEGNATEAAAMADRALRLARARRDQEAEVAALHALSFALAELGDPRAKQTIRAAIRTADRQGFLRRAGMARRRLAHLLAGEGKISAALRQLDAASAGFDEHERARTYVFRIAVAGIGGRTPPPRAETDRAIAALRAYGDPLWEGRLLRNRGTLAASRGDTAAAASDLERARDLLSSAGAVEAAFVTELMLVRVELGRGDLPACLARLDGIGAGDVSPANAAEIEMVRALMLASARLMDEALDALRRAHEISRQVQYDDIDGHLEIARLTLLAGDARSALELARRARTLFARRGTELYHARAVGLSVAAAVALGAVRPRQLDEARRAADTLESHAWHGEALRVRLTAARAAVVLDRDELAENELAAARVLRRRGPIADRIEWWHVQALLRLSAGDRLGALRAARAGLALLEQHRASLGATDLRVSASAIGAELAGLGLRTALAGTDARAVLQWAERLRASALRLDPVTPPALPRLQSSRRELRAVTAALHRAERAGGSDPGLVARQGQLEMTVRRLSRHARGAPAARSTIGHGGADFARLTAALDERALIELIESDGELTALVLADGRLSRHRLGDARPVAAELEWLRFSLTRMARLRRDAPQRPALQAGARAAAGSLCNALVQPLLERIGNRELVLAPTAALHATPWSLLPRLEGRTVTVTPSAAIWLELRTRAARRRRGRRAVLVSGPGLRHARAELNALARLYPGAVTLSGRAATVTDVLAALDGAALAHLACHGRFRADSPLFSSLELADGPLNVYELQSLRRAPELMVLSACDLAVADAHPGDELLGFASALLNMGTRTVIASSVPVPDAAAKRLMTGLHERLVSGASPATALADAQRRLVESQPALGGFVCLGSG